VDCVENKFKFPLAPMGVLAPGSVHVIGGMKGKGKIVMVGKIGKKGKIGCH
jgi:hypothetical protein